MAGTSTTVDLSQLPVPNIVETVDFETIVSELLGDLVARMAAEGQEFSAPVESDTAYKLAECAAYRETLLRQRVNDACKAIMIQFAQKDDLTNLAANFDVDRLLITPADDTTIPPTAAVYEDDESLRRRVLLSFEGLSTAGPVGSYIYHSLSANADVLDASAVSDTPGTVTVSVLSRTGDGTAPAGTLADVVAALSAEDVRPLCDTVVVQSAAIVNYTIVATLYVFDGPDSAVIMQAANDAAAAYVAKQKRLGRDITLDGVYAALRVEGVQKVALTSPSADIAITKKQAPNCTAITLTYGGVGE